MHGSPRTIEERSVDLSNLLSLFAVLSDKPVIPERLYSEAAPDRVDFYATWSTPSAPTNAVPLATLEHVGDRLGAAVQQWHALCAGANDLVHQIVEFQLFRTSTPLKIKCCSSSGAGPSPRIRRAI